jgi:F1F0 ATPase subunit 2
MIVFPTALVLSCVAGAAVGMLFFGGLWWTVQRLATAEHPGLLSLASFLVRSALALLLFYPLIAGAWQRGLAALLGFMTVRFLMARRLRPGGALRSAMPATAGTRSRRGGHPWT